MKPAASLCFTGNLEYRGARQALTPAITAAWSRLTQPRVALPKMAATPGLAGGWINVTMLSEAGVCKQGVAALLLMLPEVSVATPHGSGEAILMLVQGKKCN